MESKKVIKPRRVEFEERRNPHRMSTRRASVLPVELPRYSGPKATKAKTKTKGPLQILNVSDSEIFEPHNQSAAIINDYTPESIATNNWPKLMSVFAALSDKHTSLFNDWQQQLSRNQAGVDELNNIANMRLRRGVLASSIANMEIELSTMRKEYIQLTDYLVERAINSDDEQLQRSNQLKQESANMFQEMRSVILTEGTNLFESIKKTIADSYKKVSAFLCEPDI